VKISQIDKRNSFYHKQSIMFPALRSCIMQDYQDPSQLQSNALYQDFNAHTHYFDHCYQEGEREIPTYQGITHINHPAVELLATTQSYLTDPSQGIYNPATRHPVNYVPTSNVRNKHSVEMKPPYSYAALICMAIGSEVEKKATMREIIHYIESNFQYYRTDKKWHGTIRHDLTVNDCFVKLCPRPGQKSCLWTIDPQFEDMFSKGNFRRRRYRFKKGSSSWIKTRKHTSKQSAHKHYVKDVDSEAVHLDGAYHKSTSPSNFLPTDDDEQTLLTCLLSTDKNFDVQCPRTTTEDDMSEYFDAVVVCDAINSSPESQSTATLSEYAAPDEKTSSNDSIPIIPDFQECVEELYQSFQRDYFLST